MNGVQTPQITISKSQSFDNQPGLTTSFYSNNRLIKPVEVWTASQLANRTFDISDQPGTPGEAPPPTVRRGEVTPPTVRRGEATPPRERKVVERKGEREPGEATPPPEPGEAREPEDALLPLEVHGAEQRQGEAPAVIEIHVDAQAAAPAPVAVAVAPLARAARYLNRRVTQRIGISGLFILSVGLAIYFIIRSATKK